MMRAGVRNRAAYFIAIILAAVLLSAMLIIAGCGDKEYIEGELIIGFVPDATDAQRSEVVARHGCNVLDYHISSKALLIELPEGKDELEAIGEFEREPLVQYAELNHIVYGL